MAEPKLPQPGIPPLATGSTLTSSEVAGSPVSTLLSPAEDPLVQPYTSVERWVHRITVLMFVFVCAVLGMLLVILPWRPDWTDNHLLMGYPRLQEILGYGFVRGLCTGLGVLDVWIGFSEAIHYHEEKLP
jgi:hypothetical protein